MSAVGVCGREKSVHTPTVSSPTTIPTLPTTGNRGISGTDVVVPRIHTPYDDDQHLHHGEKAPHVSTPHPTVDEPATSPVSTPRRLLGEADDLS